MRHHSLDQIFTGATRLFAVALTAYAVTATMSQPSLAGGTTFFCSNSKGTPTTMARVPRGNVPMIRWVSNDYFAQSLSPKQRCTEVSRRFQRNYDNGTLRTLVSGTLAGQPVICAAVNSGDACTNNTLLFTLKRGTNARVTLEKLLDTRGLASSRVVEESGFNQDSLKVDIDAYLNSAAVER